MSLLQAKNRLRIVIFKILHSSRSLCLYHSFLHSNLVHFGWGSELHAASKKQSPGKQTSRGNKTLFIFLFVHPKRTWKGSLTMYNASIFPCAAFIDFTQLPFPSLIGHRRRRRSLGLPYFLAKLTLAVRKLQPLPIRQTRAHFVASYFVYHYHYIWPS